MGLTCVSSQSIFYDLFFMSSLPLGFILSSDVLHQRSHSRQSPGTLLEVWSTFKIFNFIRIYTWLRIQRELFYVLVSQVCLSSVSVGIWILAAYCTAKHEIKGSTVAQESVTFDHFRQIKRHSVKTHLWMDRSINWGYNPKMTVSSNGISSAATDVTLPLILWYHKDPLESILRFGVHPCFNASEIKIEV